MKYKTRTLKNKVSISTEWTASVSWTLTDSIDCYIKRIPESQRFVYNIVLSLIRDLISTWNMIVNKINIVGVFTPHKEKHIAPQINVEGELDNFLIKLYSALNEVKFWAEHLIM